MRRRRFRPEVAEDLAEEATWYEDRRPGLGLRFMDAVESTLVRIESNPHQFRVCYLDLRRALLPRPFPYQIYFRIDGEIVEIYAVMHGARDPERWRSRR